MDSRESFVLSFLFFGAHLSVHSEEWSWLLSFNLCSPTTTARS